jgi:hypothetical protein
MDPDFVGVVGFRNVRTGKLSKSESHPGEGYEPVYGKLGPPLDLDELARKGFFDCVTLADMRRADKEMGTTMTTQADRDFWLLEHADRISEVVGGLAYSTAVVLKSKDQRAQLIAIERSKEITARFVYYVGTVTPFVYEYDPEMPEAQLRAWAAGVVSALKGE